MGKVTRQGISSSIFIYIGMVLGFINATILFPKLLGKEIYGFCQFLLYMGELLAVFTLLGLPNVTVRFFPLFRDRASNHNGYMGFALTIVAFSALLGAGLLLLLQPAFLSWFGNDTNTDFIEQFYGGLVLLFVFTNFNALLNSYATALQRPRIPTLFSEIGGRLVTFLLILFFYFQWINQDQFIWLFTFKLIPITIGLLLFLHLIGELKLRPNYKIFKQPVFKEIRNYGAYAIFAKIGNRLINRIDMVMISALTVWGDTGIYALFYFLSQVIVKPHDGIGSIANPMIADYWQQRNMEALKQFYRRTALNNWVPAVLIFAGIVANLENAVLLVGEEYRPGTSVALFLGIAQLVHVVNGYNGMLLIHSPYYRFDLLFKIATSVFTVVSNYLFITWMGLTGAAVATALTMILQNILIQSFLYRKLHMHPFSKPMISVALFGILVLGIGLILPRVEWHFSIDILVRSGVMAFVFGMLTLIFNPAPDITDYFWKLTEKIGVRRP